ncbi:TonB-dependent receptor [Nitrosophilus kaiyonis]|uniref:TonB-dependent receptor n=1 Tax=Nitrosophilus kaiyonis TaxID=2930200 RepID=UPI002492D550|nr:TonB-dependent receptor [Nitrosophilus kaiyonis]
MKKAFYLSLVLSSFLLAETIQVEKVTIEEEIRTEVPKSSEVDKSEVKFTRQQDLGEILFENIPEINLVRASAIGNDLILRGFKKDDVNVLIDGAKIYGGCPNRMDPPAMHISAAQIEKVSIKEGPFDVENFGSMGGSVDVKTKDPKIGKSATFSLIGGSYGYKKASFIGEAGDEKIKALIGISGEESDQYKDGDGKTLVEQQWDQLSQTDKNRYKKEYKDKKAYERRSLWTKFLVNPTDNQELRLSLYKDKATDVLYPAFQMDAQLDETTMANLEYSILNIAKFSKKLTLKTYYSDVKHDMGTEFREASNNPMLYRTHRVRSNIKGIKLENSFNAADILWKVGIDGSLRNWDGKCLREPDETVKQVRIPDVDTKNRAIFVKAVKKIDNLTLKFGARYDKTNVKANNLDDPTIASNAAIQNYFKDKDENDFNNFSANIVAKYMIDDESSIYFAIGQGIRVPDAQELYFIAYNPSKGGWVRQGNPDLKETKNREVDLGYERLIGDTSIKITGFYSDLKDYIYAYKISNGGGGSKLTWANIDAHIYGGDISIMSMLTDEFSLEAGVAYQRGKKDTQPTDTQKDKDLAQIPPLKGRVALNYDNGEYFARVEVLASAKYKNYDEDNGEREIGSWGVVNLKASKSLKENIDLNIGVDNLFDKTYAVNNTYAGRSLIGGATPLLINEPGRFIYANLDFRF